MPRGRKNVFHKQQVFTVICAGLCTEILSVYVLNTTLPTFIYTNSWYCFTCTSDNYTTLSFTVNLSLFYAFIPPHLSLQLPPMHPFFSLYPKNNQVFSLLYKICFLSSGYFRAAVGQNLSFSQTSSVITLPQHHYIQDPCKVSLLSHSLP